MTSSGSRPASGSKRKERAQLSCRFCRTKKLKCDRVQPCGNCVRRGLASSCQFTRPTAEASQRSASVPSEIEQMRNRIQELEQLLISVRSSGTFSTLDGGQNEDSHSSAHSSLSYAQTTEPTPLNSEEQSPSESSDKICNAVGRMTIVNQQTVYVSDSHWSAILEKIAALKGLSECEEAGLSPPGHYYNNTPGPKLLQHVGPIPTREEILCYLPPRHVADRLVARFFSAIDVFSGILHGPTFLQEYDDFWKDHDNAPMMWIAVLYSIFSLTLTFSLSMGSQDTSNTQNEIMMANTYGDQAVNCIRLGDYSQNNPFTVEALFFYSFTEYFRKNDTFYGLWLLFGLVMRVAMRMGYHRDARHYPKITPYEAELRRRIWCSLVPIDILNSGQIGLPFITKLSQTDTSPPLNVHDQDLHKDMSVPPPARPEQEITPVSYMIIKYKLSFILGEISDLILSVRNISYSDVMQLDKKLMDGMKLVPRVLQFRPLRESLMDSRHIIMKRYTIDLLFHKARCILHRRHMVLSWKHSEYQFSRQAACISAFKTLQHQATLHAETTDSQGLFYDQRYMVNTLSAHDFLLASMILCLEVDYRRRIQMLERTADEREPSPVIADTEILRILEGSRQIWSQSQNLSSEAAEAYYVLSIMLGKLDELCPNSMISFTGSTNGTGSSDTQNPCQQESSYSLSGESVALDLSLPDFIPLIPSVSHTTESWEEISGGMDSFRPDLQRWSDAAETINWDLCGDILGASMKKCPLGGG